MGLKVLSAKIWSFCISLNELTHLPLDKMAAISQTIFSDAFWWIKSFIFWLKFHWSLLLRVQLTITQDGFRQWLGAGQATSHYLNQWCLFYWCIYSSLSLSELISNSLPQGVSSRLVNYTCQVKWQGPGEKFKLKLCTCAQSYALGTRTKFQLEILTIYVISGVEYFHEINLESSWNVSRPGHRYNDINIKHGEKRCDEVAVLSVLEKQIINQIWCKSIDRYI